MEIEFQNTKGDYRDFYKSYHKSFLQKRIPVIILLLVFCAISFGGEPFSWQKFLIGTTVSVIIILGISYFIPLIISIARLKKHWRDNKSGLEKTKLAVIDKGLLVESESKTTTWNWESITSVHSIDKFIYFVLVDKKVFFIPKRSFLSESEAVNFLGLIQSKVAITTGFRKFLSTEPYKKPSYLVGLLCLIPVIGAVVGIIFIANGISKYKDKWFILMGTGGVLFTTGLYFLVFYYLGLGKEIQKDYVPLSQMNLNTLMKDIEFYKIKNGVYPDSLEQIRKEDSMAFIVDPLQSQFWNSSVKFNYQKIGNHYYLFSSGIDGVPNTKDDIYPQVATSDSAKFGLIRKSF